MVEEKSIIRSYEKGDEEAQAEIFNTVIVEMIPDPVLITAEKVRKRHEEPEFNPEQVKYLVTPDNKIVGYTECRIHGGFHGIFYPVILKEYRTKENLDRLFKAIYEFAKEDLKKNPGTIESHYEFDFKTANEYFRNQTIAKIIEEKNANEMGLPVAELAFNLPPEFETKPLTKADFENLIVFRQSKETIVGNEFTMENLVDQFESGEMSSENSFLVYWKGALAGYIRGTMPDREQTEAPIQAHMGGMILDQEFSDGVNLRKAMLKATKSYFDKQKAERLVATILEDHPAIEFYKEIGFQIDETQGSKHYTYEQ
ncbi:MAG: GNAT family N-acetyltransferase [Candidatus Hodarchaeales archaeon]